MKDDVMKAVNAVSLERMKGDIVTQTLDVLNSPTYGGSGKNAGSQEAMSASYDFQKSVLSGAYLAKGVAINTKS